ncbi:DUF1289 domain-containing protein [Rheinheimera sp. 1928-s]|uniref:DUF1289 domain-containing protein n=1 Tax=Rheinheimera sp. 1928-s TaxID=3033803 RepID=UPI002618B406|nr:DUF1289 domain-containing protein [Rheinheimera sp. 1928-s]MDF3123786.1 DUF1289 domain-containing protein [Rheinheimera sp. 1928-s]
MPASPCNRICCLNHSDVCLGCGRTLQEIKDWHVADRTQKLDILLQAQLRLMAQPQFDLRHPEVIPSE